MPKNTGIDLENDVYKIVKNLIKSNEFLVSNPYVQVHKKKGYYSEARKSNIIFDVTVEKYLENPNTHSSLVPAIVVVIECKDYSGNISVDDVEEFHAKLQQIGADNTKGLMITRYGSFQKGAISYAMSQHIGLARVLPNDQIDYFIHTLTVSSFSSLIGGRVSTQNIVRALTESGFRSDDGESFFSTTGDSSLQSMVSVLLK